MKKKTGRQAPMLHGQAHTRFSLCRLAIETRTEYKQCLRHGRKAIEHYLTAGRLLLEAKAKAAHGEWLPFLKDAGIPERTARRMMGLARSGIKSDTVTDLGGITRALSWSRDQAYKAELREHCAEMLKSAGIDSSKPCGIFPDGVTMETPELVAAYCGLQWAKHGGEFGKYPKPAELVRQVAEEMRV